MKSAIVKANVIAMNNNISNLKFSSFELELKEYAKEKNCRMIMLNVWEFNESALDFYEKYGFTTRTRHLELTI